MGPLRKLLSAFAKEPIASAAIILTAILAIVQSDWLADWIRPKPLLTAYYYKAADGRCSLGAFSIDNPTDTLASNIRITIIPDSLVITGRAKLTYESRATGLIAPGESTPMPFRDDLDLAFTANERHVDVPILRPNEYIDFFRGTTSTRALDEIRRKRVAAGDPSAFTPRLHGATHDGGRIPVTSKGACIESFSSF